MSTSSNRRTFRAFRKGNSAGSNEAETYQFRVLRCLPTPHDMKFDRYLHAIAESLVPPTRSKNRFSGERLSRLNPSPHKHHRSPSDE
jgi:hypothetical protein